MTTQLKAKLLQHFVGKKKGNGGFTLIELLVVIIIIGILSAIALPSFLNQANKARASEAKTYIGSMNRAQQAYYLENGNFAYNGAPTITTDEVAFSSLGLGIAESTDNYIYKIKSAASSATEEVVANLAQPSDGAVAPATPALDPKASVKAYQGAVKVGVTSAGGDATTLAILCEALQPPIAQGDSGADTVFGNMISSSAGAPTCDSSKYKTIK